MAQQTPLPKDDEAAQLNGRSTVRRRNCGSLLQQEPRSGLGARSRTGEGVAVLRMLLSMRDGEADQFSRAVDSATAAVLRQALQQEHDRAEALATELANARPRRGTETRCRGWDAPGVSLPGQLNRANQLALSTNRAGLRLASTSGPTIRHPEPTRL